MDSCSSVKVNSALVELSLPQITCANPQRSVKPNLRQFLPWLNRWHLVLEGLSLEIQYCVEANPHRETDFADKEVDFSGVL